MGALERLYEQYGKQVAFFVVYVREAHPTDGWQMSANEREGVLYRQPTSFEERLGIAEERCSKLEISIPTLIDGIDDAVGKAYTAWPDRLYLVGRDGRIAYKGGPGPFGFKPKDLEQAIRKELGLKNAGSGDSPDKPPSPRRRKNAY